MFKFKYYGLEPPRAVKLVYSVVINKLNVYNEYHRQDGTIRFPNVSDLDACRPRYYSM